MIAIFALEGLVCGNVTIILPPNDIWLDLLTLKSAAGAGASIKLAMHLEHTIEVYSYMTARSNNTASLAA